MGTRVLGSKLQKLGHQRCLKAYCRDILATGCELEQVGEYDVCQIP